LFSAVQKKILFIAWSSYTFLCSAEWPSESPCYFENLLSSDRVSGKYIEWYWCCSRFKSRHCRHIGIKGVGLKSDYMTFIPRFMNF